MPFVWNISCSNCCNSSKISHAINPLILLESSFIVSSFLYYELATAIISVTSCSNVGCTYLWSSFLVLNVYICWNNLSGWSSLFMQNFEKYSSIVYDQAASFLCNSYTCIQQSCEARPLEILVFHLHHDVLNAQ